ncbi:MAG: heme biosynthesis HemY N-terminal domain-containing protein [Azonexus sp.]|nr:heme biosynthesis HemY N-terminal domain-containing protein [Azonexus sp.]MDZ4315981.1 heme biosynthesis HemY N-terminal domain-containing protein [Azonexus sp.]
MKGLFWVLAIFAAAVAVALGVQRNEGYVLLVLPSYRAEITLNFFILALFVLFFVLYGALRVLSLTFSMPQRAREYRERRQHDQAAGVFQDAVRLLFEGRFGQALKKATAAHAAGTAPGLSALIAARAAQRMRESEKQQGWMERAKRDDPRTEAATLMLEAEMMNEARNFGAALTALDRLQAKQGRHIAALRLELRARQGAKDWDGVLKLARQLVKRDALPVEVVREICAQAHLANIARLAGDAPQLVKYLRALPDAERGNRVALAAAKALLKAGAEVEAQKLIETVLEASDNDSWAPALVGIYGRLTGGDQMGRIGKAEAWLHRHPEDARILIALGRMCFRKRLWGKAQTYLEASLAVETTQEAHLELARLCDQLERQGEANKHYRASALLDAQ